MIVRYKLNGDKVIFLYGYKSAKQRPLIVPANNIKLLESAVHVLNSMGANIDWIEFKKWLFKVYFWPQGSSNTDVLLYLSGIMP